MLCLRLGVLAELFVNLAQPGSRLPGPAARQPALESLEITVAGFPKSTLLLQDPSSLVQNERIGCASFTVEKEPQAGQTNWQLQVAKNAPDHPPVWDSGEVAGDGSSIEIWELSGSFAAGVPACVLPSHDYVMRGRHANMAGWSEWSAWVPLF